jgi:hypothetical protein
VGFRVPNEVGLPAHSRQMLPVGLYKVLVSLVGVIG